MPIAVLIVVAAALVFGVYNGLLAASNVVATVISTQALGPRRALWLAAIAVGIGPLLGQLAVADTIGGLVTPQVIHSEDGALVMLLAALVGAIGWNIITWLIGIPSSPSHALIGGLAGAALAAQGLEAVSGPALLKTVLSLVLSPPLGLLAGYVAVRLLYGLGRYATPHINRAFNRGQIAAMVLLALAHGRNDSQKTMAVITLALVISKQLSDFTVPLWVILASAGALMLGTFFGGWRLIRTLGGKFFVMRPIHGLGVQLAATAVILGASELGGPVSTTHVVSSAIMGAGSAERFRRVRWGMAQRIIITWVLTIPLAALVSALAYAVLLPLSTLAR